MKKTIFPVTRIHEPLQVDVEIQDGRVVDAWTGGHLYRGFEKMLVDRDPRDASLITQRICGICSTTHGVAAAYALRDTYQVMPTENGELLSNIIFGADILQNHLRHICLLTAFDYLKGPEKAPFVPVQPGDYRFSKQMNDKLVADMFRGLELSSRAHELVCIWGAKAPHVQTILPTGVTTPVTTDRVASSIAITREIVEYVIGMLLPDVQLIADTYRDYYQIGIGYGNFLSYGMFAQPRHNERVFKAGHTLNLGNVLPVNTQQITEEIAHAWYQDAQSIHSPLASDLKLDPDKREAYTYVKAARYQGIPYEGGPLARLWINGQYKRGVSVMDRIMARAIETKMICELMIDWLLHLIPGQPSLKPYTPAIEGKGVGLTDAMRGPLGHWIVVEDYRIKKYEIITPTAWNFSPRDAKGVRGPVEQALIGTSIQDPESCIEVARIVHTFDPCFSCGVHVLDGRGKRIHRIG
jgi:hydrogenase large subunit